MDNITATKREAYAPSVDEEGHPWSLYNSAGIAQRFAFRRMIEGRLDQIEDMYMAGTLGVFVDGWLCAACQMRPLEDDKAVEEMASWCLNNAENAALTRRMARYQATGNPNRAGD